ncbi:MAG: GntR family transcriptional regulator [Actinomycetota bacterium]|nr:GntR family transcriptional regulator [Actinomycetota bacterium]
MSAAPQTRIEWVEDQMRSAILLGELPPGQRLLTAQLSERFSVSPTPLREAMQRLAGEGLVEFTTQRGARVTPLSAEDCVEITDLRCLLEPVALRHAATSGDDAWRQRVRAASRGLLAAWKERDHARASSELAYRAFYEASVSACRSFRLRQFARVVREQEARYRLVTIDSVDRRVLARDHRAMVNALLAADTDQVEALVKREVAGFVRAYLGTSVVHPVTAAGTVEAAVVERQG